MSISIQKGQEVSLSKEQAGLSKLLIGLGWDEVKQNRGFFALRSISIDCDASAILLQNGKLVSKKDLVYFGNLRHSSESVVHMGDNLTGAGSGDDEQIMVELDNVPECYDRIVIVVNVYEPVARKQHFGLIKNVCIRLADIDNGTEMYRYTLTEDYSGKTAMIFGEVYRNNGEWKFRAVGQGTNDTCLSEMIVSYM